MIGKESPGSQVPKFLHCDVTWAESNYPRIRNTWGQVIFWVIYDLMRLYLDNYEKTCLQESLMPSFSITDSKKA